MSGWLVALDFGTTATAVAVRSGDGGQARALVFGDGASTVPSSVFAESDGRLLVGVEADNEAELRLDAYEPTPKRRAADGQIRLGDRDFGVAEVIGAVLAPVLAEAMQQKNNTVPDQVVLTHPVAWRARRRAVLAEAVAGAAARLGVELPEPVFVAEPIAAAQWYAHTDPPEQGTYFAVYDLGGGTFDTTVLQATGDGFEVIASGGVDPLGGFDFDAALFDYLGTKYIAPADAALWAGLSTPGQPDPELARQRRRLQQRVGLLKLGLSTSPDKQIQLPGVTGAVVVTRGEYEALITGHIDNTIGELEDTIADAGLTPDKLTAIYRIGGAARTPLVGAALDRLRVPVKVLDQPKLVVAQGAATPFAPTPPAKAAPTAPKLPGPQSQNRTATVEQLSAPEAAEPSTVTTKSTQPVPPPVAPAGLTGDLAETPTGIGRGAKIAAAVSLTIVLAVVLAVIALGALGTIGNESHDSSTSKSTSSTGQLATSSEAPVTPSVPETQAAGPTSTQIPGKNGVQYSLEGPMLAKWNTLTSEQKTDLGAPYDNAKPCADNSGVYQQFDGGVLIYRTANPVFLVWGKVRDAWNDMQASQGKLGYPITEELEISDGTYEQTFEHGTIFWKPGDSSATVKADY